MKIVCPYCDAKVYLTPSDDYSVFICPECDEVIPFEVLEIDRKSIITINLETSVPYLIFTSLQSSNYDEFFEKLQEKIGKDELADYCIIDWQLPTTRDEEVQLFRHWKRWVDHWQSRNYIILEVVGDDEYALYLAIKDWKTYLKILQLFDFLDVLASREII